MNALYRSGQVLTRILFFAVVLILANAELGFGQDTTTVYATGLSGPIGIEIDNQGWLWVAEHGTGNNDSQVSIVTPDQQVNPFITGLPSELNAANEVSGTNRVIFDVNGDVLIVQGEGTDTLAQSILRVDPSGFTPGDPPLGVGDITEVYDIGDFVLGQGFADSNPFDIAIGPNDDLYIVDAGANAIVRRERATGILSVFATFPDIPNPTPIGPPFINTVPTGIVFSGNSFYVGSLTGFPFPDSAAAVYDVDLNGNVSVFQGDLTTVVDVDIDPRDGNLAALRFSRFDAFATPPDFIPFTGNALKFNGAAIDTLADNLFFTSGMRFAANGDLFVCSVASGEILKITSSVVGIDPAADGLLPEAFELLQNYPNPFNPSTTIRFELSQSARVVLTVHNILGQEIRTLVNERRSPGVHSVVWDGRDNFGQAVSSGIYLYTLKVGDHLQSKKMALLK